MIDEINEMVKDGHMDDHEALRLLLKSQGLVLRKLDKQDEDLTTVETRVGDLERFIRDFPVSWLSANPRAVILSVLTIILIGQLIFSPINISNIREYLLAMVGLPTDLGIPAP